MYCVQNNLSVHENFDLCFCINSTSEIRHSQSSDSNISHEQYLFPLFESCYVHSVLDPFANFFHLIMCLAEDTHFWIIVTGWSYEQNLK